MKRVLIVGGGITGLAAAHRLTRETRAATVTLIESEARLGGKIVTERAGGFLLEGGPDSFLSAKPRGLGLCRELGLAERLHGANERLRRTYVLRGGELFDLPEGLSGLVPSRLEPIARSALLSPWGKLRLAGEYFVKPRPVGGDESVASFVRRRLGHHSVTLWRWRRCSPPPRLDGVSRRDGGGPTAWFRLKAELRTGTGREFARGAWRWEFPLSFESLNFELSPSTRSFPASSRSPFV